MLFLKILCWLIFFSNLPIFHPLCVLGMPTLGTLGSLPGPSAPFPHLSASSSLSSLSNYYQNAANNNNVNGSSAGNSATTNGGSSNDHSPRRTPSPPLNPGSPPSRNRADSIPPSDDEDSTIHVWIEFWFCNAGLWILSVLVVNSTKKYFLFEKWSVILFKEIQWKVVKDAYVYGLSF